MPGLKDRTRSLLTRERARVAAPVIAAVAVIAVAAVAGLSGSAVSGSLPKIDRKASAPSEITSPCSRRYDRVWSFDLPEGADREEIEDVIASRAEKIDRVWGVKENVAIQPGEHGPSMKVRYPKNSINPSSDDDHPLGGAGFVAKLAPSGTTEACLRYHIRFEDGFEFMRGGKLPGLYGGDAPSGGQSVDGTNGFSMRLMWRRDGEGEVYAYVANKRKKYGESVGRGNWVFDTGRWIEVEQEIVLNDPDEADGIVRLWIDGRQVIEQSDIVYRTVDDVAVDGLMFSTFFGGSSRKWASPKDQHIEFAGFELSARR